jgi:TnpA family transposase
MLKDPVPVAGIFGRPLPRPEAYRAQCAKVAGKTREAARSATWSRGDSRGRTGPGQAPGRSRMFGTSLSKTDIAHRAITLYEFIDAQMRAGRDILIRDNTTGETQVVRLL